MRTRTRLLIFIALVSAGVILRLIPHAPNFAPVGGIAIFSGLYLPKRYAFATVLLSMFLGDLFIGFYKPQIMVSVYASFLMMVFLGMLLKNRKTIYGVALATVGGSVLFFLVTNAAVWGFGTIYAHTWTGLTQCYTMALPFFRNTLLSDMIYTASLVGGYELVRAYLTKQKFSGIFAKQIYVKN